MAELHRPYELTFEKRPGYLFAKVVSDSMTVSVAKEYLGEIAAKSSDTAAKRVLVFRDVEVMLPDSDLFDVTHYFLDLMRGIRIAFVNPHSKIHEDMEFAIRIGTNRGGVYKLFNNVAEAEKWLLVAENKLPSERSLPL